MDNRHDHEHPKEDAGMIFKAAGLDAQDVTEEELREINKYTLAPLTADEVFTFKAVLCDNEIDRQYEQFTAKSLQDMRKLYLGRTVIKDHIASADNQVARIYETEVVDTGKLLKSGDPYQQLVAHCYMVRTASNADLIKEIQGGIKKEGSVGFRPESSICSICGTDNVKSYCKHWAGRVYDKEGGKTTCTFKLDGVKDAYEFSLVAVPAQRAAGVSKSYTGETIYEPDEEPAEEQPDEVKAEEQPITDDRARELALRARLSEAEAKVND